MPIRALRPLRKMRGGAQAYLFECSDEHFYVVKFTNNPQHRRVLTNEWIGSAFLSYLDIATPAAAVIDVPEDMLAEHPEVCYQLGNKNIPVEPGWHFGSQYPGDPGRLAVYDYVPDPLLAQVANTFDFRAAFVFDKWTGNADSRQAIFFRARLKDWTRTPGQKMGFVAQMMDNGYLFGGPNWTFADSPLQGIYFRRSVYSSVRSLDDFEPWLERIRNFPEEIVDDALKRIPLEWTEGDRDELENLMHRLMLRRKRVPELIRAAALSSARPFVNWGSGPV